MGSGVPKRLEVVEHPLPREKDVDHDLDVVQQDPGPISFARSVERRHPLGLGGLADCVGDGTGLAVGIALADHEEVSQGALLA